MKNSIRKLNIKVFVDVSIFLASSVHIIFTVDVDLSSETDEIFDSSVVLSSRLDVDVSQTSLPLASTRSPEFSSILSVPHFALFMNINYKQ